MNFFHENAAITQVHAASEFMDAVCQIGIPTCFLLIIALLALHLAGSINSDRHSVQATPQSETESVAHQHSLNGQRTELACSVDDAPLASQHWQFASPLTCVMQFKPKQQAVDYTQFTIRQLKKAASSWNQAHPQQKIQNLGKLTKSQLIERLTALSKEADLLTAKAT